jgi:predicted transcriptional regulator
MQALIVKDPWASMIVSGEKTIEIRTMRTKKIGKEIYIAKSGTKTLIGKVTIEKCLPLTANEFSQLADKHKAKGIYPKKQVYGWFLTKPIAFKDPLPYSHPQGAQMWVRIDS